MVVVDAGSTDGTKSAVTRIYPAAEVVDGRASMWWTATVNHGINHIAKTARTGDRVILMNDDVYLDPQALNLLIEASIQEPQAIIGAVNLLHRSGDEPRVFFCGGQYDLRFARHKVNIKNGRPWRVPSGRFLETDIIYGRLLIIPWVVFQNGCRFDEETFPQYGSDEDFCYARKLHGFKLLIDSKSIVYVNEETTSIFSLNLRKVGLNGIRTALTAFNSPYNWKQGWAFARRYAKWPCLFMFSKYSRYFISENRMLVFRRRACHD